MWLSQTKYVKGEMTELELTSPGSITEETVAQGTVYGKQDVERLRKS